MKNRKKYDRLLRSAVPVYSELKDTDDVFSWVMDNSNLSPLRLSDILLTSWWVLTGDARIIVFMYCSARGMHAKAALSYSRAMSGRSAKEYINKEYDEMVKKNEEANG